MKHVPLPLALFLAALTSFASAQIQQPLRETLAGFPERPDLIDGLMVATVLGPPLGHPLGKTPYYAVQRVRVVDSRAFAPGTVVDVVFRTVGGSRTTEVPKAGVPIDPSGAMATGTRVLILGRVAKDGLLRSVGFARPSEPEPISVPLDIGAGPTVFGGGFFPTAQSGLVNDPDPKWRLLASIAAAIPGANDETARALIGSAEVTQQRDALPYGGGDDRFSLLLTSAVAKDTAYHRALVDLALNRLRYWGYGDHYSRDLRAAAVEPDAFPDGLPAYLPFVEDDPRNNPEIPKDFKSDPPLTQDEIMAVLARAKSPTIAAAFLPGLTSKPSDADVRSLARFLDSPDVRLRWAIVERLCVWNGATAPPKPTWQRREDGTVRTEAIGLDEAVALWKARVAALPQ